MCSTLLCTAQKHQFSQWCRVLTCKVNGLYSDSRRLRGSVSDAKGFAAPSDAAVSHLECHKCFHAEICILHIFLLVQDFSFFVSVYLDRNCTVLWLLRCFLAFGCVAVVFFPSGDYFWMKWELNTQVNVLANPEEMRPAEFSNKTHHLDDVQYAIANKANRLFKIFKIFQNWLSPVLDDGFKKILPALGPNRQHQSDPHTRINLHQKKPSRYNVFYMFSNTPEAAPLFVCQGVPHIWISQSKLPQRWRHHHTGHVSAFFFFIAEWTVGL